jgi:hypothetical protein
MLVPNRHDSLEDYRYGFNGKEKDDEIKGEGNSIDLGDRILDPRIGRTFKMDRYSYKFPGESPYSFAMNTPMCAVDPDGKLIIFIGGLRLCSRDKDQLRSGKNGGLPGIYKTDVYKYWGTAKNSFGKSEDIAGRFIKRIGDDKVLFTSGSSKWKSQAEDRNEDGVLKGEQFHAMVQSGEITLAKGETIKIVSHSQGGAHAEGFAEQLMSYKDSDGNQLYKIEVIYNITPHQPGDINAPDGIRTVQYSHPNDAVSSKAPFWLPNGGSKISPIKGIGEYDERKIIGGEAQPKATGAAGNRNGHNVTDNGFIFDIEKDKPGYVAPRQDSPGESSNDSPDVNKGG